MLLVTGPAGSGKTSLVLDQFRNALRRHDSGVRLLAPTATMVRHVQNRVAREDFVPCPALVQTLSRFVESWTADLPQISDAHFYLVVEAAARRSGRPEFARVVHMPGFCASLARTLQEFSSAGCDSRRLARSLPATPLGEAFLAVFEEVDRELQRRGLATRSIRLEQAAARIREGGMNGISTIWLDGFHALPDPELAVIEAMAAHADVTVTLPPDATTAATRARLLAMGFTERSLERRRPQPAVTIVEAPGIEREADEIARRILAETAAGRPFREIGVIVRSPDVYEPVLRATLERFGIPGRFYLDSQLVDHGVSRYLAGIVDALLGGWEPAAMLAVLRLHPAIGNSRGMDEFAQTGRSDWPVLNEWITRLRSLDRWRQERAAPREWAARVGSLREFYPAARTSDPASRELAMLGRSQTAALGAFQEAIDQAADWFFESRATSLVEFWRAAKAVLRLSPLRPHDERRNVVHILSAYEARQWELPVIFVCGMVEKQFPRYSPQDPFFPDSARRELQAAGIRLRTTADAELEEEFLFDSAITRATASLTLTYPKYDGRGELNLPSLYLERFGGPPQASKLVLPRTESAPAPHLAPGVIEAADLREMLAVQHRAMRVTAVESYAQCPFQFFGRYTLRIEEPPKRPEERLDARVQGNIVHQVAAEWQRTRQEIGPLFDRIFEDICRKEKVAPCYRTEALRQQMRADVERLANDTSRPPVAGTRLEEPVEFALSDTVVLKGRIDRLDPAPDGRADVIDYKYTKNASDYARDENRLQGPLYLLAVEKVFGLDPGTMYYCGLRGAVKYVAQEVQPERVRSAVETTLAAAGEIRAGNAAPRPADLGPCRYCTFKDVCRYRAAAGEFTTAEGA
jgi:ATP-dependent helicase/DNAse subunit B